nr:immunoglobulin light chain junction region [Macaca mulatta]
CHKYISTPFTF